MIQLSDILTERAIFVSLKADGKAEVLNTLNKALGLDAKKTTAVTKAIFEREAIISTGVGSGIALPHCKLEELDENYCSFAILDEPLAFGSIDNLPVKFIFLLASPKADNGQHLKLLSRISRILSDKNFREKIVDLNSSKTVLAAFREEELKVLTK